MFRGHFASKPMTLPEIDHVIFVAAHAETFFASERDRFTVKRMLINQITFFQFIINLSVKNPTHMYLSDLRVYFKVELYFRVT